MATLKVTQDLRRKKKDGTYPIIFRLTQNQKSTAINTNIKLNKHEWDNVKGKVTKSHINHESINLYLKQKLLSLEKKLLEINSQNTELNLKELREALLNENKLKRINFHEFATNEIQTLRDQQKYGNAAVYETAVNRFIGFTGNDITLDKINYTVISDFDTHLIKDGVCRNSISVYMRGIRALLNKAIKKELLDRSKYAFRNYTIRNEKTVSRAISKSDLDKIKLYPLEEGSKLWHSRNIFFLIFNLIGISFADLAMLTKDNVQNGRIVYRRKKTGKMYSIKITCEAERLFGIYKGESKYLISRFKLDDVQKQDERLVLHQALKTVNKFLKRLGNLCDSPIPLTTYVARYSWANVAKSLGYSKDLIAEALGHEYGNKVTGIYLDNYGDEIIDAMNEKVTAD